MRREGWGTEHPGPSFLPFLSSVVEWGVLGLERQGVAPTLGFNVRGLGHGKGRRDASSVDVVATVRLERRTQLATMALLFRVSLGLEGVMGASLVG